MNPQYLLNKNRHVLERAVCAVARSLSGAAAVMLCLVVATSGFASPPAPEGDTKTKKSLEEIERAFESTRETPGFDAPKERGQGGLWIEHHGMFRFRPDFLFRGHLDTHTTVNGTTVGTSRVFPPITENFVNNEGNPFGADSVGDQDDDTLAGVNVRFRYKPTLHIAPSLRVGVQLDLLDNLVLGSTPNYGDYDAPLGIFSQGQQTPNSGTNGWVDSVRVRQVYGAWDTPIGSFKVGRQSYHWGLGMVHHAGQGFDDNYGDYVDRALWEIRIPHLNLYTQLMYDYVADGATTDQAAEVFGQNYGASRQSDTIQFGVSVFQKAKTQKERALRYQTIHNEGRAYWEWGLFYQFRSQRIKDGIADDPGAPAAPAREAILHLPDLWLSMHMKPDAHSYLTLDMEFALGYGSIANGNADGAPSDAQDILNYGFVLKGTYSTMNRQLTLGLDAGFASGDETSERGLDGLSNPDLSLFGFDRDFKIDQILFREVLGSIHNAYFVKPWVQWDFNEARDVDFALRADLQYAAALNAEGTPSGSSILGYELDVHVYYLEVDRFRAGLSASMLLPGSALNLVKGYRGSLEDKEADWALRFYGHLAWMF